MQSAVKYMFDRDFDDLDLLREIVEQEAKDTVEEKPAGEPEPPAPPPAPVFSEEDMALARRQGYERGKKEGIAEMLAGIEQKMATALDKIASQSETLFRIQSDANETIQREAAALSLAIARKLFPKLNEDHGLDEVVAVAQGVLAKLIREPRITISVDEGVAESIATRLSDFLKKRGFQGELSVRGDGELGPGECRIEWMGGDAIRDVGTLLSEIEAAIARHTGAALSRLDETQG